MANLESESRRLYSWWWDSHVPKNSKWIQENLADMDSKVKTMIKLIEADADSFARRAEMYYKKRPELVKLVEELYRAYRALAERYDHTTVELRHAHKAMAEAFPNQIPFDMIEDSASSSYERHTEVDTEDLQKFGAKSKISSTQLDDVYGDSDAHEADSEIESLKRTLLELQTEKEALNIQYQLCLNKLSIFEKELNDAQKDVRGFDEHACKSEIEIKILKESLAKLEVERDTALLQYRQSMERIADMEASLSHEQEHEKGFTNRASKAEREATSLKKELSRLQSEKEAGLARYNRSLELISALEKKIRDTEESVKMFRDQSEQAEGEIEALKQELMKLNEVHDDLSVRYQQCLGTISNLERELSDAQDNAKRLSSEVLAGAAKVKTVEEQCAMLESFNQNLKVEADNLAQKMSAKDQELVQKQNELEKLQALKQEEQVKLSELGASLQNLESLYSQSQEEQKVLTLELQSKIQILKDLKMRNHKLEGDICSVEEENRNLSELNASSTISLKTQQNEISCLKVMKEKLEEEVAKQMNQSSALQVEIHRVKGNIDTLNRRYQNLIDQVKLTGFDPESLVYSVKKLRYENSKLLELCTDQRNDKDSLTGKLYEMDSILRKNADLEKLLVEANTKLGGYEEKAEDLQKRCESLQAEKSELAAERAKLFSQLQIMAANVQKLLEKNSLLERSLSGANIELESLRDKSKCFENFLTLLKNDKSQLIKERESLVSQLYEVEKKLGVSEKKFIELESKYADLQRDKILQVEELQASLATEKQEHADHKRSTDSRLADLQKNVSFLREECRSRKREYEEELDRVVNKQVEIFVMQKIIEDLEQKNFSLLIECQKYVEASEISEKLISELESENLEQQMEAEIFLDEIDSLRSAIYQVLKALQVEADYKASEKKITKDQPSVSLVLGEINGLKSSLSSSEYEKQRLVIENSVLLSLLGQFQSDGLVVETEKNVLEKDLKTITQQCGMLEKDKQELLEANQLLKLKLIEREQQEQELRAKLQMEHLKFENLHESYMVLQQDYSYTLSNNKTLLLEFSELKDGMRIAEEENDAILQEAVALSNMCVVYRSFGSEMAEEVEALVETLSSVRETSMGLKHKVEILEEKLKCKEEESQGLNKMLENLEEGLEEDDFLNGLLEHQVFNVGEILEHREMEIVEAEDMLKAAHNANKKLHKEVEELRKECEESRRMRGNLERQISELRDLAGRREEEITKLNILNENLESEVELLHNEIQLQQVREEYLILELQEKSNEIGLWDSEATSFYFDLQISAVRELLLENKVKELTGVCENLKDESVTKTAKIRQMKETVGFLESQVTELKTQLSVYEPVIESLAGDVKSLEKRTQALRKFPATAYQQRKGIHLEESVCQEPEESSGSTTPGNGIVIMHEMKPSIKTIEQTVFEEKDRPARQRTRGVSQKSRDRRKKEEMQLEDKVSGQSSSSQPRLSPEMIEMKNGLPKKEIPSDQMTDSLFSGRSQGISHGSSDQNFEFWEESAESETSIKFLISSDEPKRPLNSHSHRQSWNPSIESEKTVGVVDKLELSRKIEDKAKIMERLLSDSRRLSSLRISLTDLKSKLEMNEKQGRFSKADLIIVKSQMKEIEDAILQLANTNEILAKEIEETGDARDIYRKVLMEKSRNGSEKIEQLQNKMQTIEQTMLKLGDRVKSKRSRLLSESRTVILLRDIIHKGGKRTARKKKNRFCGCIRSSAKEDQGGL